MGDERGSSAGDRRPLKNLLLLGNNLRGGGDRWLLQMAIPIPHSSLIIL